MGFSFRFNELYIVWRSIEKLTGLPHFVGFDGMFIFNLILMSIRWLYIGLVNHTGPTVV
jgi:hypothetical protein